jgi:formylglycine-generating enzyme required for sulfatase activity
VERFSIGVYELTQSQWRACFDDGGCSVNSPSSESPVFRVSWNDAQDYLSWISNKTGHHYRLPSEAEWEYAARAGTTTPYSWGNEIGTGLANCNGGCGENFELAAPVGSFPPNAFGLHDMHGNLYEWVEECRTDNYQSAPTDGSAASDGNCQFHTLRGGSWSDQPNKLRSAFRGWGDTVGRFTDSGFRVVRD